jgi:hypothetical protein
MEHARCGGGIPHSRTGGDKEKQMTNISGTPEGGGESESKAASEPLQDEPLG